MDKFLEDVKTYEKSIREHYKRCLLAPIMVGIILTAIFLLILLLSEHNTFQINDLDNQYPWISSILIVIYMCIIISIGLVFFPYTIERKTTNIFNYVKRSHLLPENLTIQIASKSSDGYVSNVLNICDKETNQLIYQIDGILPVIITMEQINEIGE